MHSSRLSTYGSLAGAVLFILLLLPNSIVYARIRPVGFQIPSRMISLGRAVTPGEYALLRQAIKANWNREKASVLQSGPPLGTNFTHITATRIRLGSLGQALIVYFGHSPECGATGNCPMAVYVRERKGYRRVISAGGWGYALLPSGSPVPDVAFYSNMSAAESDAQLFHYANGTFVQARTAVCNGKNSSAICTAMGSTLQATNEAISPAQYHALHPLIESDLEKQSPALARRSSFENVHGVSVFHMERDTITAVGAGSCGINQNCNVSIYVHHFQGDSNSLLLSNAPGWGISLGGFENSNSPGLRFGLVIARRLSANEDELTRFSTPLTPIGHNLQLTSSSRMLPNACEIVTPKTGHWPARWDAAALVAKPIPCFKIPLSAEGQIPAADTTNVSTVVQDGTGAVWGMGGNRSARLYRWRNGGWSEVPSPVPFVTSSSLQRQYLEANGMVPQPIGLWPGPNGGVLALWLKSISTQESELVWLRGSKTKILASLPAVKQPESLDDMDIKIAVAAARGIVLVTGDAGDIFRHGVRVSGPAPGLFRVDAKGNLQRIYTFARDQYLRFRPLRPRPLNFLPLHATRDAQGKVWIWCGWSWPGRPGGKVFAGFLVTDGKTVEYHRRIPGLLGFHITSVSGWDNHHLAVSVFNRGIYTINTTTLEARPLPEPEPGAFRFVKKVFTAGEDHYVLTIGVPYGRWMPPIERPFLRGDLWRWHQGKWKQVLAGIGNSSGVGLATPKGFWLGARNFHGLWFVPNKAPAQRVNWRQGLPIATIGKLFRLPDGHLLAYGRTLDGPHAVEIQPASLLVQRPAATRFSVLHPLTNIEPDHRHNLWCLLPSRILGEWNGMQWVRHPLPSEIAPGSIVHLDVDTRGRVWLFPNCRLGPMGFFNPVVDRWSVYRTYRIALEQRAHPVRLLHPAGDQSRPIYGPDSQIVFVGACWGVNYFDGASWRLFQGMRVPRNRDISIPPFFDAAGHLALNVQNLAWQWTPQSGWQRTGVSPPANSVRLTTNPFAPQTPPPAGCETPAPSALVKDSLGQSWWVADDALYEGVPGHCRKVLSASAHQPFIDGRKLVAVKIGPRGNAFLMTGGPFSYIELPRSMYTGTALSSLARRTKASSH